MKKNNIISDWLDKHGDPEIEKRVEERLFVITRDLLKKEYTPELKTLFNELQEKYKKEDGKSE